jgi:hypothetical protein
MPASGRGREGAARRVCVRNLEGGGQRKKGAIGLRSNGSIEGRRDGLARHLSRGIWKPSPSPVLEVTALVGNSKLSTRADLSMKENPSARLLTNHTPHQQQWRIQRRRRTSRRRRTRLRRRSTSLRRHKRPLHLLPPRNWTLPSLTYLPTLYVSHSNQFLKIAKF